MIKLGVKVSEDLQIGPAATNQFDALPHLDLLDIFKAAARYITEQFGAGEESEQLDTFLKYTGNDDNFGRQYKFRAYLR